MLANERGEGMLYDTVVLLLLLLFDGANGFVSLKGLMGFARRGAGMSVLWEVFCFVTKTLTSSSSFAMRSCCSLHTSTNRNKDCHNTQAYHLDIRGFL